MNSARTHTPPIMIRPTAREDAPAIGAVFDAAVRAARTYLGDPLPSRCSRRRTGTGSWPIICCRTSCWSPSTKRTGSSAAWPFIPQTGRCSFCSFRGAGNNDAVNRIRPSSFLNGPRVRCGTGGRQRGRNGLSV